jgi:hypothetical protein
LRLSNHRGHSGAPQSGEPGIHTPQRWDYGFRPARMRATGMTKTEVYAALADGSARAV